ncbi:GntR family transcriptional regulator [Hoeflea sp. Naph1]|uniref:GntR family transcriptional regulator n=1 Tax=Hoeflea sp. Naph1 TaxID=3388653 RepID=UPI00398FF082
MSEPTAPVYRRIASALEADIAAGKLNVGDKLPSERVMAEELGISRMTARQALQHLTARGILVTRTGHGTFVGRPVIQQKLSTLSGFTEEIEQQGRHASSVVMEFGAHKADDLCSVALNLPLGGDVYRLVRVRLVDGEPVAMETTEIRANVAPGLLDVADFASESLYAILREHYHVLPASAEQTLQAALSSPAVSRTLQLGEHAPVLELTRRTCDANGNPFEYVRSVYRGDSFVMKANLTLGANATQ